MLALPEPTISADTEGAISNRIVIRKKSKPSRTRNRVLRPRSKSERPKSERSDRRVRGKLFDVDRSVHGKPYVQVCCSMPATELDEIDRIARVLRKSRSALIRTAIVELRADLVARRIAGIVGDGEVAP